MLESEKCQNAEHNTKLKGIEDHASLKVLKNTNKVLIDCIESVHFDFTGSHHSIQVGMQTQIEVRNGTYFCTFECYSCSTPFGNSVEFILNDKTLDELREDKKKCYHKSRECHYKTCVCCTESNRYVLKHEMSTRTQIRSFGCKMRFEDSNDSPLVVKQVFSSFNDLRK